MPASRDDTWGQVKHTAESNSGREIFFSTEKINVWCGIFYPQVSCHLGKEICFYHFPPPLTFFSDQGVAINFCLMSIGGALDKRQWRATFSWWYLKAHPGTNRFWCFCQKGRQIPTIPDDSDRTPCDCRRLTPHLGCWVGNASCISGPTHRHIVKRRTHGSATRSVWASLFRPLPFTSKHKKTPFLLGFYHNSPPISSSSLYVRCWGWGE